MKTPLPIKLSKKQWLQARKLGHGRLHKGKRYILSVDDFVPRDKNDDDFFQTHGHETWFRVEILTKIDNGAGK